MHYFDALDDELKKQPVYIEPVPSKKEKTVLKNSTDSDCGYINQEHKKGLVYLIEITIDTKTGLF